MNLKKIILLFLVIFAACSTPPPTERTVSSIGNLTCDEIIHNLMRSEYAKEKEDFFSNLDLKISAEQFKTINAFFKWAKNQYISSDVQSVRYNLDSLLFIDYKSSINELMKLNRGEVDLEKSSIYKTYGTAFNNYKKANEYLLKDRPLVNITTLKKLHTYLMENGVDNLDSKYLGKIRDENLGGMILKSNAITPKQFYELSINPYISISDLHQLSNGHYYGHIGYPHVNNLKPEIKEKLKVIAPHLLIKIEQFEQKHIGNSQELTGQLINVLTEDLLSWFVKQRDDLGEISTPEEFRKFVNLVAVFQKNLISIHPFRDGNGRTVRQFALYYSFLEKNFPPPRLIDPDADLYSSTEDWVDMIIKGSRNSQKLYESLSYRLKNDLPIGSTPELLLPHVTESLKISLKTQRPLRVIKESREAQVDIREAVEYFIIRLNDKNTMKRFLENTSIVYDEILTDFEKLFLKDTLDYEHEKKGLENLSIHFIDSDFIRSFAKASLNTDQWNSKMNSWYRDEIIWRGLSSTDKIMSENEILSMFTELHPQFISNRLLGKINASPSKNKLIEMAVEDFNQYNQDLINGGLEKMAKEHSETGPLYGISYGYSTSKKREVGKAFAMGAMVIAPYGRHMEMQYLLKSRVLVGMKRAQKDVDLSRLKQLRPDFSYKYPRQQEVMGIGAADPDSIMIVQLIDARGEVVKSYVRDPQHPFHVLVFEKEMSDLGNIPKDPAHQIELVH